MKASLIYCQLIDSGFTHTMQNAPTHILNCNRMHTQVAFLPISLQSCCLILCICLVCVRPCRSRGSGTRWSIHLRVRSDRQDHRLRSNTSHWCRCPRSAKCWTCRTQRVMRTRIHTHTHAYIHTLWLSGEQGRPSIRISGSIPIKPQIAPIAVSSVCEFKFLFKCRWNLSSSHQCVWMGEWCHVVFKSFEWLEDEKSAKQVQDRLHCLSLHLHVVSGCIMSPSARHCVQPLKWVSYY